MNPITHDRASAVIFQNGKLLLIRRIKPDREYYSLIGGSIEDGEDRETGLIRETLEEVSLTVLGQTFLFTIDNRGRLEHHFLITKFTGVPKLGGPELEYQTPENQFIPTWVSKVEFTAIEKFYPQEARNIILELWTNEDPDVFERARALNFPVGEFVIRPLSLPSL